MAIGWIRAFIGVVVYTERQGDDISDIPELGDEFFRNAELRVPLKRSVTLRIDEDVLSWFKSQEQSYQSRVNKLLRRYMENQQTR